jgi:hypothetical protein
LPQHRVAEAERDMRLPIRNYLATPITLFIEPYCEQHEIPPGGEAIVTLDDGEPHSLDFHPDNWVSLWNEGSAWAKVEVFADRQSLEPKPNPTAK